MTRQDIIRGKTPEQISKWSDEKLCDYAPWNNPAIKSELLKRNLFTEQEFNYVLKGAHQSFPRVGMRKCAMWTFSHNGKLLSKTITPDGAVREEWKVHRGESIFFFSAGHFYVITIENDKIVAISEPEPGTLSYE